MALLLREPAPARKHLLAVGTATYREGWPTLGQTVHDELREIQELFLELFGYSRDTFGAILDPGQDLTKGVAGWAAGIRWEPDDIGVLYYTGHGVLADGSRLRLVTSDVEVDQAHVALLASELVSAVWGGPANRCPCLLVIVDTCHSGGGAIDLLTTATALKDAAGGAARGATLHVIASARSIE